METQKLYRGRLIDHLQLVVKDVEASKKFYVAIAEALGIPVGGEGPGFFYIDELFISNKESVASNGQLTGRSHFALQAQDEAMVKKAFEAGLAAGGRDNGKPGPRQYHPGYFAGFLLDPDGHNVEVVYHGPAKKSAESIEITF